MKGLILVGGRGTRLGPLTRDVPKPLIEFANKPMLAHQVEALVAAGVTDIILAVHYKKKMMKAFLEKCKEKYNINIEMSVEQEPLDTAGPLKLAERFLIKDDSPFFVLNSDVICDYPFQPLLEFHRNHGAEGTMVVTEVSEPSKYGVVVHQLDNPQRIDRFVEKPTEDVGNLINAGIYIFNTSVLKRIELRRTSIEKEIFPSMAKDGQLHSFKLDGYWMDVGQPKDFLRGTSLYLSSLTTRGCQSLTPVFEPFIQVGEVLIHPSAEIGQSCKIGPVVVIGPGVVIGDGVCLENCVIYRGCKVQAYAFVGSSLVGWNSTVGRMARVENSNIGGYVHVHDGVHISGAEVLPELCIKENVGKKSLAM